MDKGSDIDMTRLESGVSFLRVKEMLLQVKEKLWQVQCPICVNHGEIAHPRLEAVDRANNPHSLIAIYR
jgi:hypothetical protein